MELFNCKITSNQKEDGIAFTLKNTDVVLRGCTFYQWNAGLFLSMRSGSLSFVEYSLHSCECGLISAEALTKTAIEKCEIKNHKGWIASLSLSGATQ